MFIIMFNCHITLDIKELIIGGLLVVNNRDKSQNK